MRRWWMDLQADEPRARRRHWYHGRGGWGPCRVEIVLGGALIGGGYEIDPDDGEIHIHCAAYLFAAYLGVEIPRTVVRSLAVRHVTGGFSIIDGSIGLKICGPWGEIRSADPWWRRGIYINPADLLLGRAVYSEEVIEERDAMVPMPEGCYAATARLWDCARKRPRWPFARRHLGFSIDVPNGIPIEGKGENSWDCGEDATYGLHCTASSIEEGVGMLVASVLRDRWRRGGRRWTHRDLGEVIAPCKIETRP